MQSVNSITGKEVLVLEDDILLGKRIEAFLSDLGMEVTAVGTCAEAQVALKEMFFDFALFDLNLPDGDSLNLLKSGYIPENTLCILMTGEGGVKSAVESIRLGAADYLSKPFDIEELPLVFQQAQTNRKNKRLVEHVTRTTKEHAEHLFFEGSFAEDLQQLEKILSADNRLKESLPPLLIDGPTGAGKSTYARWIHANGPRSDAPFIALNCSAITENLIESELFGHEKGAFTDAKDGRIGLFEAADGGTLFLDEVASLSLSAQAKLLLAIESQKIRRVGGNKDITIDVRIIAAANCDLRKMITEGKFREDLFHRLDLLRISIPPLSQRSKDLPKLADHFLVTLSQKYHLKKPELDAESMKYLQSHSWPGNNRELLHELERALVLHEPGKQLRLNSVHSTSTTQNDPRKESDWLNENFCFPEDGFDLEKEILRLLQLGINQSKGNVSAAARLLGVPRDYLRYRLKDLKQ
ncbi:MAG: sigma-54 dependent transcriptional regulator [Opitutae bacterium]